MDKSKFIELVTSHILEYLPKEYQDGRIEVIERAKNNDTMLHGLIIRSGEKKNIEAARLTRQLSLRRGVTKPSGEEDFEKMLSLNKNGSILSPEDREHELNMIMPEQVARFFLFDAELLQEYEELLETNTSEGEQIKNSIEKILGVPVLQNGVIDIEECLSNYERQKSRAAKADGKTTQLGLEMEALSANIEMLKDYFLRMRQCG